MKVVLFCADRSNHRALANRLHAVHPLVHIALIEPLPLRRGPSLATRLASASIGRPLRQAWNRLFRSYNRDFPDYPDVKQSQHQGVNAESVLKLVKQEKPDAVLVSGTDLLKAPLINQILESGKVLNLHTGISPYLKGAPNCTNWALAIREFDLIGNTIMWLDVGIDSGALIATERTPLTGNEDLFTLHRTVMDHAHDLYCRAYDRLVKGVPLPAVPQNLLGPGRLYLSRQWNALAICQALFNFKIGFTAKSLRSPREIRLVSLDEAEVEMFGITKT